MKKILIVLFAVSLLFAYPANWNGARDTVDLSTCSTNVLVQSDSIFEMSGFEDIRIIAMVDDTASAGYDSDSIQVEWGYQTFSLCYDTGGNLDTCYNPRIVIDTLKNDSLGKMRTGKVLADGSISLVNGYLDTTSCAGYAVQSVYLKPEWDAYFRLWAQGLSGNVTGAPLELRFTVIRKLFMNTRGN